MGDHAIPNLPSRDLDTTVAFYGGFGFVVVGRDEGWLSLRRGGIRLEFFRFPELEPARSSFMCSIRVDDVETLYRQIAESGVSEGTIGFPRLHPIRMQPWGQRAGFLLDPDGTQLALIEDASDAVVAS